MDTGVTVSVDPLRPARALRLMGRLVPRWVRIAPPSRSHRSVVRCRIRLINAFPSLLEVTDEGKGASVASSER